MRVRLEGLASFIQMFGCMSVCRLEYTMRDSISGRGFRGVDYVSCALVGENISRRWRRGVEVRWRRELGIKCAGGEARVFISCLCDTECEG